MQNFKEKLSSLMSTTKNIIHFRITKPTIEFIQKINWFRILGYILSTILFVIGIVLLIYLFFKVHFWKTLVELLIGGGLITAAMYVEMYFEVLSDKHEN